MKKTVKGIMPLLVLAGLVFSLTGCVEHRYYRNNHHHSRRYYDRHHMPPPPGINFEIHN